MEIETVRVTPAMLPPTISTTPNSPMVWAKLRMAPVAMPGSDSGTITRRNVASARDAQAPGGLDQLAVHRRRTRRPPAAR